MRRTTRKTTGIPTPPATSLPATSESPAPAVEGAAASEPAISTFGLPAATYASLQSTGARGESIPQSAGVLPVFESSAPAVLRKEGEERRWETDRARELIGCMAEVGRGAPSAKAVGEIQRALTEQHPLLRVYQAAQQSASPQAVLAVVMPGSGPLGAKKLNDVSTGLVNRLWIPKRDHAIRTAAAAADFPDPCSKDFKTALMVVDRSLITPEKINIFVTSLNEQLGTAMAAFLQEAKQDGEGKGSEEQDLKALANVKKQLKVIAKLEKSLDRMLKSSSSTFARVGLAELPAGATPEQTLQTGSEAVTAATMAQIYDSPSETFSIQHCQQMIEKADQVLTDLTGATFHLSQSELAKTHSFPVVFEQKINPILLNAMRGKTWGDVYSVANPEQQKIYDLVQSWVEATKPLDFIFYGTREDLAGPWPQLMERALSVSRALTRGEPVEFARLRSILFAGASGELTAQTNRPSEALFYESLDVNAHLCFVAIDVARMATDALGAMGEQAARLKSHGEFTSQQFSDAQMDQNERVQEIKNRVEAAVYAAIDTMTRRAIEDLEGKLANPSITAAQGFALQTTLEELRRALPEQPVLLLGGDEITFAFHGALAPYLSEAVRDLKEVASLRVSWTESNTASTNLEDRSKLHELAVDRADAGHGLLKEVELLLTDMLQVASRIFEQSGDEPEVQRKVNLIRGHIQDTFLKTLFTQVDQKKTAHFFAPGNLKEISMRKIRAEMETMAAGLKTLLPPG